jgi:hypothetical protein
MLFTGVMRSVPNQVFIWMNSPIRLRQGGRFFSFSQQCCEKEKVYHAAAGDSAVHRVKRPV